MQNPMGCDPKANGHCPLPRLSISSRSASVVASMDASYDGMAAALHSVMKWKTVLAVFVVVLIYLICGGLAFHALEQPFESNQKNSITLEKASFLERHPCVTPDELEALIKVSFGSFWTQWDMWELFPCFSPYSCSDSRVIALHLLNCFITNGLIFLEDRKISTIHWKWSDNNKECHSVSWVDKREAVRGLTFRAAVS